MHMKLDILLLAIALRSVLGKFHVESPSRTQ